MKKTNRTTPRLLQRRCTAGAFKEVFNVVRNFMVVVVLMLFTTATFAQPTPPEDCACHGQINVNLDGDGEADILISSVVADILCFDFNMEFQLRDTVTGEVYPDTGGLFNPIDVTCDEIGLWKAEVIEVDPVTGERFMQCWGYVLIEDKTDPVITCPPDDSVGCNVPFTPFTGFRVEEFVWEGCEPFNGTAANIFIPTNSLPTSAIIQDVNLKVEVTHSTVGDVRVRLTNPTSTVDGSLLRPGACTGSDIDVVFDDEAADAFNCGGVAAISGVMQVEHPTNLLSDWDGLAGADAIGDWRVRINDNDNDAFTGVVTRVVIQVSYSAPDLGIATAEDNCEDDLDITWEDFGTVNTCQVSTITRVWTATDPQNNTDTCHQTITVFPNTWNFPTAKFPDTLILNCSDIAGVDQLHPDSLTQYNTADKFFDRPRLFPADHVYCGQVGITYSDLVFDNCEPYGYKIRRTWTIADWCSVVTDIVQTQVIKVVDEIPPVIACPSDSLTYTVENNCVVNLMGRLPDPEGLSDNCAAESEITVTRHVVDRDDGSVYKGASLAALPKGRYTVIYRATDPCNNFSECSFPLTLIDLDPPTPICDQNTTLSLGWDGTAWLCWETINDGSYDNCTDPDDLIFRIRRMDQNLDFDTCITFTCDDLSGDIMVQMRVWDDCDLDGIGDNYNDCMVNVTVQDKLRPYIVCPSDVTMTCNEDHSDLDLAGEAEGFDNCDDVTVNFTDSDDLSACGVGTVSRTWRVTDPGGASATCVQTITKEDNLGERPDILYPSDLTLSCIQSISDLDPDDLAVFNAGGQFFDRPQIDPVDHEYCGDIFIGNNDKIANQCENAFTIQRVWKALDLCYPQFNEQHIQFIYVIDNEAPVLTVPNGVTVNITDNDCDGLASFTVDATDNCSSDGNIEITNDVNSQVLNPGGTFTMTFSTNTTVTFTAEDDCDNVTTETVDITVVDGKAPTARCQNINLPLKSTGIVLLTPNMIDAGSDDNCDDPMNLTFRLEEIIGGIPTGIFVNEITYDCDDFLNNNPAAVNLVVTDQAGNTSKCLSTINIQEGLASCQPVSSFALIGGSIEIETGEAVADVNVALDQAGMPVVTTDDDGKYLFNNVPTGSDYMVMPEKDIDWTLGVSTIDIVRIRRHMLDKERFDSPYKIIAADVNNDQSISTLDIVYLRQLLLDKRADIPGNTSWRFVDEAYIFRTNDPLTENWPDNVMNSDLNQDQMYSNFVAVKTGDVDNSVADDLTGARNTGMNIQVKDQQLEAGKTYEIAFTASDFNEKVGFQFTMAFNSNDVEVISANAGNLPNYSDENFGLTQKAKGLVVTSWDNKEAITKSATDPLFFVTIRAKTNTTLSDVLTSSSALARAEVYDNNLNIAGIDLRFDKGNTIETDGFALYQKQTKPIQRRISSRFQSS